PPCVVGNIFTRPSTSIITGYSTGRVPLRPRGASRRPSASGAAAAMPAGGGRLIAGGLPHRLEGSHQIGRRSHERVAFARGIEHTNLADGLITHDDVRSVRERRRR